MKVRKAFLALAGFAGLAATLTIAPAASAATTATPSGAQYCYYNGGYACLNAWGGGPLVKVYTGGPLVKDNNADFTFLNTNPLNSSIGELEFTGGGSNNGKCLGDDSNNSGLADAALVGCGSTTTSAGWGTSIQTGSSGCATGKVWIYDFHWKAYVGPPNNFVNGSHFYLNTAKACFSDTFFVG